VDRAERAVGEAESTMRALSSYVRPSGQGVQLLEQARARLASIGQIRDEDDLKRALAAAAEARNDAQRATRIFRDQANAYQNTHRRDDSLGDFLGGVIVGSMMEGSRSSHRRGGGSSGGWGSGGGSSGGWGGGGGSGWSGGGGGGGGWGGGGGGGSGW
jgi:hypothetical protein